MTDKEKNRYILNLLVAHFVMYEMPDNAFVYDLARWKCDKDENECGSPACFGGWVGRIPFFKKQGVLVEGGGQPFLKNHTIKDYSSDVSDFLFGDSFMFIKSSYYEKVSHPDRLSDREVILNRIERVLKRMLSQ